MIETVKVGVIDSGCSAEQMLQVTAAQKFTYLSGEILQQETTTDILGHGSSLFEAVADKAPKSEFYVAQVFENRFTTTALQVAAAIDWMVAQGVQVINLSLGLRNDRDVLRTACLRAVEAGIVLCASTPARGEPVYPAAYPGVFRMTGDARCGENEFSCLDTRYADFGGYVKAANGVVGASAGCGHLTGHIAGYLVAGGECTTESIKTWLTQQASYFGVEVRSG